MINLLSDNDVELYMELIRTVFTDHEWNEFGVQGISTLRECGLDPKSSDKAIWLYCQAHAMLLVTGNRNEKGPDSLGRVIGELNLPEHLPVLTIAMPGRVSQMNYREDCAYRIADIAMALDRVRGSGRLFIP